MAEELEFCRNYKVEVPTVNSNESMSPPRRVETDLAELENLGISRLTMAPNFAPITRNTSPLLSHRARTAMSPVNDSNRRTAFVKLKNSDDQIVSNNPI